MKPVLNDLYAKIYSHDANQMSIEVFTNSDYQQESGMIPVPGKVTYATGHGVRKPNRYIPARIPADSPNSYPHLNIGITDFFIHLNTVWLFALLEELVLHHVKKEFL